MVYDSFYSNNKITMRLEEVALHCKSYEEFEQKCSDQLLNEDSRIGDYLSSLLYKYDKKASVVSIDALLASSYVGNIINGKKNNPSRNVLLRICFALKATVEETQALLKYAGHSSLYVRKKRDVIIWFGLMKKEDLDTVNENLISRGFSPLYKD